MDDKTFIENYLNQGFKFSMGASGPFVVDLYDNKNLQVGEFKKVARLILGLFYTSNGSSSHDLIDRWFDEKSKIFFKKLNDILHYYRVVSRYTGWITLDQNNKIILVSDIQKALNDEFCAEGVAFYYEEWFMNKIYSASQRMMGIIDG